MFDFRKIQICDHHDATEIKKKHQYNIVDS